MHNVCIVTPSYLIKKKRDFGAGLRQLAKLGFNVSNPEFPQSLPSPLEKANQIHGAFADPGIDMLLALRGGYSAMKSCRSSTSNSSKDTPKSLPVSVT